MALADTRGERGLELDLGLGSRLPVTALGSDVSLEAEASCAVFELDLGLTFSD